MSRIRSLALLAIAGSLLAAAPAYAEPACPQGMSCSYRTSDWLAPLDNRPYTNVRLFGLAEVPANEGVLDRALRLVAGAGLVYVAATDPGNLGVGVRAASGVVGAVGLWTGLTGDCLLYIPFGASTRDAH